MNILLQGQYDKAWHILHYIAGADKVLGKRSPNIKEREEKSEEAKGAIGDQYTQWRWKIRKNGEASTQGRNLRIGKQIMSMRHSLFS